MVPDNELLNAIPTLCRRKLLAFAQASAPEWQANPELHSATISEIVTRNYSSGRIHRMPKQKTHGALDLDLLDAYVERVISVYYQSHERVNRLRQFEEAEWGRLSAALTHSASIYLKRHGYRLQDTPEEHAQEACLQIRQSVFPFDVSFDAWAKRILFNHIVQAWRKRDMLDAADFTFVPLDRSPSGDPDSEIAGSQHEQIVDERAERAFKQVDDADLVWKALRKLRSRLQREVILAKYRDGLADGQVAERMGKSVSAIQMLRHHALRNLRKIMVQLKESDED
jgi:RNA polymerase sigma factor (sigma-70 family)